MFGKILNKWKKIPETVKISVAYTICSILQKCLSFITLPLFTRMLTQEQYGQYNVYTSWSSIFSIFLTLNLAYGSFSTAMVKFPDKRDEYIASVQGICLCLSGAFLLIYLPLHNIFDPLLEMPTYLVVVMILELLAQTCIALWSGKKRFEFKYKSVIAVTLLNSVFSVMSAFLLVTNFEEKGYARIVGFALVPILIGGFLFFRNTIKGKGLYHKEYWKYALSFNIPLLVYYISQSIFNQSDRILISHICGTDKAAMYGVAYNFAMILMFVLTAINNSYMPWLYGKIKENRQEENRSVANAISVLLSLMLLCVIWYAPEIIRIMAGEDYLPAVPVVAPVAISLLLLFYTQMSISVEFYFEKKLILVIASVGSAALNIGPNALLLSIFGFTLAGYTTLLSYIIFMLSNYIGMRIILKKEGITKKLYDEKSLMLILVLFAGSAYLGVALYNILWARIVITGIVTIALIFCRNILLNKLSLFIRKGTKKSGEEN